MTGQHLAVYPGSFDPVTYGHLDVIERAGRLFDELVIGVGQNPNKPELFTQTERVAMIEELVDGSVCRVERFRGLTVDYARRVGASAILKGVRNISDLRSEVQQAVTNREVAGLETVFIVAGQSFAYTSSSLIKQITALGEDLSVLATMVPPSVLKRLQDKKDRRHPVLERLRTDDEES